MDPIDAASKITSDMRERLPIAARRRLDIREMVVCELRKLRMDVSESCKREVDKAALEHAEKMLMNSVASCHGLLQKEAG